MLRIATVLGIIAVATLALAFFSFDDGLPPLPDDPQGRGAFVFAIPNDPGSLDPGTTSASTDFRVVKCLYEPLLVVKWGGEGLEPGSAEAMPQVSEDGLTYTFKIRKDAKWSDGHAVSAEDFVYGWRRALLPDSASDYASLFYVIEGAEDFYYWRQGLMDFSVLKDAIPDEEKRAEFLKRHPDLESNADSLSDKEKWDLTLKRFDERVAIKALDDRTLQVKLSSPTAYFVDLCAFPTFSPMPEHVVDPMGELVKGGAFRIDDAYFGDPLRLVSNGPYTLRDWEQKVRMIFDQNPYYWNKDAMGNVRVVQETIADPSLQLLRFEEGLLDWIPDVGEMKQKLVPKNYPNVHTVPSAGTYYYQFNCREALPSGVKNPMADIRVRQAMGMCIDRKTIVENVTRMREPIAKLVVPDEAIPGYTGPVGSALTYDPKAAAKLLAEAGYPGGEGFPPIEIMVNNDAGGAGHARIALAVKKSWEDHLGLQVTLDQMEFKVLLDRSKKGNFHVRRAGWFGDYIDPTTWLDMHRSSDSNNDSKYFNAAYDKLLQDAAVEPDKARRFEMLAEAEALLMQEAPIVPIFYYATVMMYDKDKVDLRPNAWNNLRLELIPMKRGE